MRRTQEQVWSRSAPGNSNSDGIEPFEKKLASFEVSELHMDYVRDDVFVALCEDANTDKKSHHRLPQGASMFKEERNYNKFKWEDLGDIERGRPNLGLTVPVFAYRLLQYTLRDTLIAELGVEKANDIIVKAGRLAGAQFCQNMLDRDLDFNEFISQLQSVLREQAIGILRVEKADLENMVFTLTVEEDLDCSGLPFTDEVVCQYDEGYIAGIMEAYTGKPFQAKEIDCWASGDRVCRFDVRIIEDAK